MCVYLLTCARILVHLSEKKKKGREKKSHLDLCQCTTSPLDLGTIQGTVVLEGSRRRVAIKKNAQCGRIGLKEVYCRTSIHFLP